MTLNFSEIVLIQEIILQIYSEIHDTDVSLAKVYNQFFRLLQRLVLEVPINDDTQP